MGEFYGCCHAVTVAICRDRLFPLHLCPADLGLVVLLAIMETLYVRTGNEVYKGMVKFWGKLFLINFVLAS